MGLACTRFSRPDGFLDRGNHSCAGDLAALARAVLRDAAARADRAPPQRRAAVPDQGRQALPLQQQPAAARGLPRARRGSRRATRRPRGAASSPPPGARPPPRRRAAALARPGTPGVRLLDRGLRTPPLSPRRRAVRPVCGAVDGASRPRSRRARRPQGRPPAHRRRAGRRARAAPPASRRVRLRHRALPERELAAVALDAELLGVRLGGAARDLGDDRRHRRGGRGQPAAARGGGAARDRARARLGPRAARRSRRCCPPTARPARRARRCCSPTSAPRRCAARTAPSAPSGSSSCSAPTASPIHLNPVQEAVQPEGEPDFAGVLEGIAAVVARLAPRPVVVKEVGFGLDPRGRAAARAARASPPSTSPAPAARTGR